MALQFVYGIWPPQQQRSVHFSHHLYSYTHILLYNCTLLLTSWHYTLFGFRFGYMNAVNPCCRIFVFNWFVSINFSSGYVFQVGILGASPMNVVNCLDDHWRVTVNISFKIFPLTHIIFSNFCLNFRYERKNCQYGTYRPT